MELKAIGPVHRCRLVTEKEQGQDDGGDGDGIKREKTEPSKSEVTQRKVNHDSRLVGGEAKTSHFAGFTTVNPASVYI